MIQNSQQHTNNKIYNFLKTLFIICKIKHFLVLRHATTYSHTISLLRVLFCYPFYIFSPSLLVKIMRNNINQALPTQTLKKQTRFQAILSKAMVGMCFGFLFWLPFWCFILESILPPVLYGIFCVLLVAFMLYLCAILIRLKVESHNNTLCKKTIYCVKRYIVDMALPFFLVFIILCVGIFSLLHKNTYIGVSLCYPLSIAIFLFMPRMYRFWFGFFVGVFGFYWMTLSFRFEGLSLLIPIIIVCVGIIYGLFFWILLYFQNLVWRIIAMALLFILHPLDFNWLNLAYLSSYSVFEASLLSLLCVGFACYFIITKSALQLLAPLLLLMSLDYDMTRQNPKLQAKIIETQYPQDMRWEEESRESIIVNNLEAIQQAIDEGYPLVILPETSFPMILNTQTELYNKLLDLSRHITIVTGAMRVQSIDFVNIPDSNACHVERSEISKSLESSKDFSPMAQNDNKQNLDSNPNGRVQGIGVQNGKNLDSSNCRVERSKTSNMESKKDFSTSSQYDKNLKSTNTHKKHSSLFTLDTLKQREKQLDSIESSYINVPTKEFGYYNSVYIFSKGYSLIADKNALVPFGETLPFNAILSPLFEEIFGDSFGFNKGNEVISFITQGLHVAIANCYEGTMELPYNTGAKYILMLSNNAWFYPSTQNFMQQMIMKYYARSFQTFIYHSTNYTPKAIITPNNGKD